MQKNLVIISIDSLRCDGTNYNRDLLFGKGEHTKIHTPTLDDFARRGASYINAYSTNTYTTSAHASLFTGKYPMKHGIRAFFDFNQKLNPKHETLAETLSKKGFQTFFYSDIKELFSIMDIWRGFKIKTDRNMNWLWNSIDTLKKERNFIFIHTFDIHEPYLFVEDKSEDKKINEEYYDIISDLKRKIALKSKLNQLKSPHDAWGEIRKYMVDNRINQEDVLSGIYHRGVEKFDRYRLKKIFTNLDSVGINSENTLFLLLSDHGEGKTEFANNLNFGHSGELTEETLKIFLASSSPITTNNNELISMAFIKDLALKSLGLGKKEKKYFEFRNNLFSKEKYIYAETYIYYLTDNNPQMTDKIDRITNINNKFKKTDHIIYNRGFVGNNSKLIIKNRPEKIHELFKQSSYSDLINKGFHYIMGRKPEKETHANLLKKLKLNQIDKNDFINILFGSDEKKIKPFLMYFKNKNEENLKKTIFYNKLKDKITGLVRLSTKTSNKDIESLKKYIDK